jgi:hypothetical protein
MNKRKRYNRSAIKEVRKSRHKQGLLNLKVDGKSGRVISSIAVEEEEEECKSHL